MSDTPILIIGGAGKVYEVTGLRALTFGEAVAEIAAAVGRPIRYRQTSREEFSANTRRAGVPAKQRARLCLSDKRRWRAGLGTLPEGLDILESRSDDRGHRSLRDLHHGHRRRTSDRRSKCSYVNCRKRFVLPQGLTRQRYYPPSLARQSEHCLLWGSRRHW
jgi:hypothetical protein